MGDPVQGGGEERIRHRTVDPRLRIRGTPRRDESGKAQKQDGSETGVALHVLHLLIPGIRDALCADSIQWNHRRNNLSISGRTRAA
jgi:hypothetical protein